MTYAGLVFHLRLQSLENGRHFHTNTLDIRLPTEQTWAIIFFRISCSPFTAYVVAGNAIGMLAHSRRGAAARNRCGLVATTDRTIQDQPIISNGKIAGTT